MIMDSLLLLSSMMLSCSKDVNNISILRYPLLLLHQALCLQQQKVYVCTLDVALLLFIPWLCPEHSGCCGINNLGGTCYVGPETARLFMTSSTRTRTVSQFPEQFTMTISQLTVMWDRGALELQEKWSRVSRALKPMNACRLFLVETNWLKLSTQNTIQRPF